MYLNTLTAAEGAKHKSKRVGRGIGSGLGKTSGKGHKGQKARSGGYHKVGFEGGQMPLQRRLPKRGFRSRIKTETANIRLSELNALSISEITLDNLLNEGLINKQVKKVKIFLSGEITKSISIQDKKISVTAGAVNAIVAAGGKVQE